MITDAADDFHRNVKSVHELIDFDRFVINFAIEQVETLQKKRAELFDNPAVSGEHSLQALRNVRDHDSLRHHYQVIFNQAVVLLVSYFGSAVGDIFRASVPLVVRKGKPEKLLKEEMTIKVEELLDLTAEPASLGEVFMNAKKGISFQDMGSTVRTFADYVGVDIPRDEHTNNVVIAQAFRHAIVHKGGRTDRQLMKQVLTAVPRTLKKTLTEGEMIQFTPVEVRSVSGSMGIFVDRLVENVAIAVK